MANSLLDFVMSVVRDPGAAAAYAADPAQAIADANLSDVTSVDVNHLIPVVAESLSASSLSSAAPSGGPSVGADALGGTVGEAAHNVWASGAATAAFDAFGDHLPLQDSGVIADHVPAVANVIDQPVGAVPTGFDHVIDDGSGSAVAASVDPVLVMDAAPAFEHVPAVDAATVDDAVDAGHHLVDDHLDHPQDPGFDIFS